ncbi:hypothetical protein ACNKXS_03560 [Christiangramia marina]|uniref:hypothetical protein n=1 Tax=Christiangramia marina TaxID=409436 RepID=UPI003AA9B023
MKIFRILAMLTISLLLFTGCEDDEITNYAFQEISAPTDVTADFDISQDDTGTVTITPSGVGAQTFQIDLGNGDTAEIANGESVTTVYDEGEYMVEIVAVGSTGLTSEYNQMLNISFKAPENLVINVDQPDTDPKTITVSATADNATVFDVYFGDMDDEEPTQLMPGESIQHTYEPGVYELTVIARGAGAATLEEDEIIIVPEATDPLKLPVTFDMGTVNYAAGTFNGTSYEVVINPDLSGANTSETNVAAVTNSGAQFEGIAYTLGEPVDFSTDSKTITMKLWSDVALPVLLKFEDGVNGERQTEVSADHGGTGWEVLSFDFASDAIKSFIDGSQGAGESFVPTGQYSGMVIFIDGPGTTAGTFYIDDIEKGEEAQKDPAVAPDAPTAAQENVFSIFSDAYTNPANINYFPNWGQSTTYEMISLDGDNVIKYANANYQGIEIGESVDATAYEFVNIDIWSGDYTSIVFFLISSTGEKSVNLEVAPNQWNSIQIPLTEFTSQDLDISDVYQFKFDVQPNNGGSFYIDNLYFSNEVLVAPTEPVSAAATPTEPEANVISLFSDAYTNVSVDTWRTDWSDAVYSETTVEGNNIKLYDQLNFVGIETVANQVDASAMTHFHVDYWTGNATAFRVKLVDFGPNAVFDGGDDTEHEIEFTVTPNTWVKLDIPLSDFTGLTNTSNIAQYIFSANPTAEATVYIDNVYFHN